RIAACGEPVWKLLGRLGYAGERVAQFLPYYDRAHREISGRDAFGGDDGVRLQVVLHAAPHLAGSSKAGDDLIRDEGDVVFSQDGTDGLEVTLGRRNDAASALHRLGKHAGDRIGAFLDDQFFQLAGETLGEFRFGFARLAISPIMRTIGVLEAR